MKTVQELRALQRIAEDYQRRGYTIVFEPPAASLPPFLSELSTGDFGHQGWRKHAHRR